MRKTNAKCRFILWKESTVNNHAVFPKCLSQRARVVVFTNFDSAGFLMGWLPHPPPHPSDPGMLESRLANHFPPALSCEFLESITYPRNKNMLKATTLSIAVWLLSSGKDLRSKWDLLVPFSFTALNPSIYHGPATSNRSWGGGRVARWLENKPESVYPPAAAWRREKSKRESWQVRIKPLRNRPWQQKSHQMDSQEVDCFSPFWLL